MNDITFLELRYFLEAAEQLHMTRAAEKLQIGQPSLSRTISTLERQLGVELFGRIGRNIVLTPDGERVLRHTKKILTELDNMERDLESNRDEADWHVNLSVFAASKLLPGIIMNFQRAHPQIRLHIMQENITTSKEHPPADLSVFSSYASMENDHCVTLLREDILLAVPVSHPLAQSSQVNLADFAKDEFICLQAGKNLRSLTDCFCSMAGFSPHVILECDSPGTTRTFIQAGIGVAFIPAITWSGVAEENMVLIPISTPHCQRYISLSWAEDANLSQSALLMKEHLIHSFKSISNGTKEQIGSAADG